MEEDLFKTNVNNNTEIQVKSTQFFRENSASELSIDIGTQLLFKQIRIENLRQATIRDYEQWWNSFIDFANVNYLSELDQEQVYNWLSSMEVKDSTRLIRLKSFKACLGRFYNMGYIRNRWWESIKIKVDTIAKGPTTEESLDIF